MSEAFEVFDERFRALLMPESRLEHLAEGCIWAEGPVWLADDSVVWSDIPNNRMLRWSAAAGLETFRQPSNFSNGNTLDRQGRLVTCEHGARRVSSTEADGSVGHAGRALSGRTLQFAQRRGGAPGRQHLVHRPALRHPARHGRRPCQRDGGRTAATSIASTLPAARLRASSTTWTDRTASPSRRTGNASL